MDLQINNNFHLFIMFCCCSCANYRILNRNACKVEKEKTKSNIKRRRSGRLNHICCWCSRSFVDSMRLFIICTHCFSVGILSLAIETVSRTGRRSSNRSCAFYTLTQNKEKSEFAIVRIPSFCCPL